MKKSESTKMTSKVLYELLIRSYEQFKYFSQTWNFTISKNTNVNHRKSEHYEKLNFNRKKIQKWNFKKRTQNPSRSLNLQFWTFWVCFSIRINLLSEWMGGWMGGWWSKVPLDKYKQDVLILNMASKIVYGR